LKKFQYQTTHLLLHTNCFGDLDPHPILVFPPLNDDLYAFLVRPDDLGGWQHTLDAIVLFRRISPSEVSPTTHVRSKKHSLLTTLKAQKNRKKGSVKKTPKKKKHTETSRRSTAISLPTEEANNKRHKSTRMLRRRRRERETQQRHKKQHPGTPICTLPRSGGNPNPGHPLLQRSNGIARIGPYA